MYVFGRNMTQSDVKTAKTTEGESEPKYFNVYWIQT